MLILTSSVQITFIDLYLEKNIHIPIHLNESFNIIYLFLPIEINADVVLLYKENFYLEFHKFSFSVIFFTLN